MSEFLDGAPRVITPVKVQTRIPRYTHAKHLETMSEEALTERVVEKLAHEIVRVLDEMGLLQLRQEVTPEDVVYCLELDVLSEAPKLSK